MEKFDSSYTPSKTPQRKGVVSYSVSETVAEGHPADVGAHNINALVSEAKSIQMQLAGADLDGTKQYLARLQDLLDRIPRDDRRGRRSARIIDAIIVQAQRQLNRQYAEEVIDSLNILLCAEMQITLYQSMSSAQQHFYVHIDNKQTYMLPAIAAHGGLAGAAADTKEVSGQQLRERFSVLHYHSLSEAEKQSLLNKTFGEGAICMDAPLTKDALVHRREELAYLRDALQDMEAYKAYLTLSESEGDVRMVLGKIAYNHSRFDSARAQIDALEQVYATLEKSPQDKTALAALEFTRGQLQEQLKNGVMQNALVEDDTSSEVAVKPALLLLPAVGAIWGALHVAPNNGVSKPSGQTV